jgi:hypothetical protein
MPGDADTRYTSAQHSPSRAGSTSRRRVPRRTRDRSNHVQALDQLGGLLAARGRVSEAVPI